MKKRILTLLSLFALFAVLSATAVFAQLTYRATYVISENGTASYNMLPIWVASNNQFMIDNGFINNVDALDTRIETLGGLVRPHMITDNMTLTAVAVPLASQTNLYFTTGNSLLSDFDIITGIGGNITTADNATLELVSGNWSFETSLFIDPSINSTPLEKLRAVLIETDASGNVTASIRNGVDWITPDTDIGATWSNRSNAHDDDTATSASDALPANEWSGYLQLHLDTPILIDRVRFWISGADITLRTIQVYYNGGWNFSDEGGTSLGAWETQAIGSWVLAEAMQIRCKNGVGAARTAYINEADCGADGAQVTVTSPVTVGERDLEVSANTTHMNMFIDGSLVDSEALSANVTNNSNNWEFLADIPYSDNVSISVDGTQVLLYEPVTYIRGTTMPDLAGTSQNGTITWGTNPTGVTVSLGSMVSSSQPAPGQAISDPAQDILPEVEVTDWFLPPDVSGALLTNPLRPFVTLLSGTTTLTEIQSWRLLAIAFVLLVTLSTAKGVRGHHFITGIACGASWGGMVVLTIFPLWSLVFMILPIVAGAIAERSPSL